MILIYTSSITSRIRYIFNIFFRDLLQTEFQITDQTEAFLNYKGARFSYCPAQLSDEVFFESGGLLHESGIREVDPVYVCAHDLHGLFPVKRGCSKFDFFASAFYLISRYEEYFPFLADKHGRFDALQSVAYKNGFLNKPVIDQYALFLFEILSARFPGEISIQRKYSFQPTFDIDIAYAFRSRGLIRSLAGATKSLSNRNYSDFMRRFKVLLNLEKDPFDTYEEIFSFHESPNRKPVFFFLLGDYGRFDKNLHFSNQNYQSLIKALADYSPIGIHPSYNSSRINGRLQLETDRLAQIIRRPVTKSRQHFLKLRLPHTYRNLLSADLREDYTMGYANHTGFRAGTCSPFMFYDLDLETETKLKVYPFAVMDGTLHDYLKLSPAKAMETINNLIEEVKNVKGTFISLWHNESLSEWRGWTGWREVYAHLVEKATEKQ